MIYETNSLTIEVSDDNLLILRNEPEIKAYAPAGKRDQKVERRKTTRLQRRRVLIPSIALVEGSVLRDGDEVRFTVRLIRGSTDENLWTENYGPEVDDVLILQSEVAQAIAHEISATITPEEEKLLGNVRSIDAPAYEGLAESLLFLGQLKQDPSLMAKSEETIVKALEIDDTLPGAHTFLGTNKQIAWDFADAETEYRRAIELNPNAVSGRTDEARQVLRQLQTESEQSYVPAYFFTVVHAGLGENDLAPGLYAASS